MMQHDHRDGRSASDASGFVCPRCGGAIWEQGDGAAAAFECRMGDRFSEAEMWIEHSATRNRAVQAAARALAEHAALARRLASSARRRGDAAVAVRLEAEAQEEDRLSAQVRAMVAGLPEAVTDGMG